MSPTKPHSDDNPSDLGPTPPRVAVYPAQAGECRVGSAHLDADETLRRRAAALAEDLHLPTTDDPNGPYDILLVVDADRLSLRETGSDAAGPVFVDFVGDGVRCLQPAKRDLRQPIARAVGLGTHLPTVLDATAGLGRDAFLLAWLGCRVTTVERSAIVAAVLADALKRARRVPALETIIEERLNLVVADARDVLRCVDPDHAPDVVYLDPMFPARKKTSARAKKEMRLFRKLVGYDEDAGELFNAAIKAARRRVVVKRHPLAPSLAPDPTTTHSGKIARYDVYLTPNPPK